MTTELVLLLAIFAFMTGGIFFGDKGPIQVFQTSGPRLGARMEQHIATGRMFKINQGQVQQWEKPDQPAPDGTLK
jgi:hypothetical protein